ncbi:hypothetical protein CKO36_15445 [Rhabdochromatium marinum]|nr:hypothetical protein [Rhabdochromatium marinum]
MEKTNRLSFELIRERALPPAASTNEIRSEDVREVLSAALGRIRTIQQVLGVGRDPVLPPPAPQGTETDLFMGILHTNRQVNLLLDRRYSPSDVFWQVTVAVSFADAILAQDPSSGPPPAAPEFQAGKRPADVFGRLVACYALVHRIGDRLGLHMLELTVTPVGEYEIFPSDVYDIASLLVSELTYIHQHLPEAPPPQTVYRYGGKFPSDVFQRAGILLRQLLLILAR